MLCMLMLFTLFLLLLAAAAYIAEDMKRIAQVSSNLEQLASPITVGRGSVSFLQFSILDTKQHKCKGIPRLEQESMRISVGMWTYLQ